MVKQMRNIVVLLLFLFVGLDINPAQAQAGSAYDLINAVNQLRAANGLPPYQIDPILMAIAQAHSEYQASIGTVTHTGPGGSRPLDRAYAAGFGGGNTIFISENIAGGLDMSVETAIYTYWQDSLHMHTMLHPNAQYVGAGVAFAGEYVYYTLDVGYISGAPAPSNPQPPSGNAPDAPTQVAYDPFIKSTPREDGAIIHVVGYGQTLIGIANTYGIPLQTLLDLNGLNMDSTIYPGDRLFIQMGNTATPTSTMQTPSVIPSGTPTSTATARPTRKPTLTPMLASETAVAPEVSMTPQSPTDNTSTTWNISQSELIVAAITLAGIVLLVTVVLSSLERRRG